MGAGLRRLESRVARGRGAGKGGSKWGKLGIGKGKGEGGIGSWSNWSGVAAREQVSQDIHAISRVQEASARGVII